MSLIEDVEEYCKNQGKNNADVFIGINYEDGRVTYKHSIINEKVVAYQEENDIKGRYRLPQNRITNRRINGNDIFSNRVRDKLNSLRQTYLYIEPSSDINVEISFELPYYNGFSKDVVEFLKQAK